MWQRDFAAGLDARRPELIGDTDVGYRQGGEFLMGPFAMLGLREGSRILGHKSQP
jgi:hypothetical protein